MTTPLLDEAPERRNLANALRFLFWGNLISLLHPLLTLRVGDRVSSTDAGLSLAALALVAIGAFLLTASPLIKGLSSSITAGVAGIYAFSLAVGLAAPWISSLHHLQGPGALLLLSLPALATCGLSVVFWSLVTSWQQRDQAPLWLATALTSLLLSPLPFVAVATLAWHRSPPLLTLSGLLAIVPPILFLVALHRLRATLGLRRSKAAVL